MFDSASLCDVPTRRNLKPTSLSVKKEGERSVGKETDIINADPGDNGAESELPSQSSDTVCNALYLPHCFIACTASCVYMGIGRREEGVITTFHDNASVAKQNKLIIYDNLSYTLLRFYVIFLKRCINYL